MTDSKKRLEEILRQHAVDVAFEDVSDQVDKILDNIAQAILEEFVHKEKLLIGTEIYDILLKKKIKSDLAKNITFDIQDLIHYLLYGSNRETRAIRKLIEGDRSV